MGMLTMLSNIDRALSSVQLHPPKHLNVCGYRGIFSSYFNSILYNISTFKVHTANYICAYHYNHWQVSFSYPVLALADLQIHVRVSIVWDDGAISQALIPWITTYPTFSFSSLHLLYNSRTMFTWHNAYISGVSLVVLTGPRRKRTYILPTRHRLIWGVVS